MRVVVTRPQISGQKTATLLRALGHEPVLLPLTEPVHHAEKAAEVLAERPAILAVTSAEAIRALLSIRADISAIFETPLFAVGKASADAARQAGFRHVVSGQSDGTELAQLIAEAQKNDIALDGRLVYLAGSPRESGFETRLTALDVPFETAEIYTMKAVDWQRRQLDALLSAEKIDAVLFYSAEAVRLFFSLMEANGFSGLLRDAKFICISEKVRANIPEAFRHAAFASLEPRQERMFDLLGVNAGT